MLPGRRRPWLLLTAALIALTSLTALPASRSAPNVSPAGGSPTALGLLPNAPEPASPVEPTCVDLAAWPIADQLNQLLLLVARFDDLAVLDPEATAGVGGLVFIGQPRATQRDDLRKGLSLLSTRASDSGKVRPWLATDEEGGYVQRLADVIGPIPSPRRMAQTMSPGAVQAALSAHGAAMKSLGIDMDLGPVVDAAPPDDFLMDESDRSFSPTGTTVSDYALAYAAGLRASGVEPVLKHFPGLGRANADTDLKPAADPPLAELEGNDLIPFARAFVAGQRVVMTSHATVPGLTGGAPASLAPATYAYLRRTLGFAGVAMTDDLAAGAISGAGFSEPAAAVAAIAAGADAAMVDASEWQPTLAALVSALRDGSLTPRRVIESTWRLISAKGLTPCPIPGLRGLTP